MKYENQFCTLEQSKKLVELGVTSEGCSHYYVFDSGMKWRIVPAGYFDEEGEGIEYYPAYSVAELGVMLGIYLRDVLFKSIDHWYIKHEHTTVDARERMFGTGTTVFSVFCSTQAEAYAALLIYRISNGLVEVSDVNEHLLAA